MGLHDFDGGADAGIVFLAGEVESVAGEFLVGAGQFDLAGGGIEIEKSVRDVAFDSALGVFDLSMTLVARWEFEEFLQQ